MHKVLFVTSEAHPLIKTGGLADVCGSLPVALQSLHADVRLLLPAYRDALTHAGAVTPIAQVAVPWIDDSVTLLEGRLPGARLRVWLVDYPPAFDRPGNPYLDAVGRPWYDNAMRFALFARVAATIALGDAGLSWRPDVVHCHDWQAALVPALLTQSASRPATVFTVHNLSYQGLFPPETFASLDLPPSWWSLDALEFHGQMSFIKGGLTFADRLTTVSPTYAREIQTPALGYGLEGLLRYRASRLTGILNGIDTRVWDPAHDPFLAQPYSARSYAEKVQNKLALQQQVGLPQRADVALLGMVGRLVEQKGVDLVLDALAELLTMPVQLAALGSGEAEYERRMRAMALRYPAQLAVHVGYDEGLAHRVEAGSDMFLMPSRFEPCGLNQLYSLRYGTVPIVQRVGGLADTVVDATPEDLQSRRATGIVMTGSDAPALVAAVRRGLELYRQPRVWKQLALAGMRQDFSWRRSASEYLRLYDLAVSDRRDT